MYPATCHAALCLNNSFVRLKKLNKIAYYYFQEYEEILARSEFNLDIYLIILYIP